MFKTAFPSKLLENAVSEFANLPGIGKKTALRLVLYLLRKDTIEVEKFGNAIIELSQNIKKCKICKNISDNEICEICSDESRDKKKICVVENIKDVMAIEKTAQYNGLYHVIGGLISPMDGIGPGDLKINKLIDRVAETEPKEVVLALNSTPEGDTTNYYIFRRISKYTPEITMLARGVAVGSELEYADEITLGSSIKNRIRFTFN